MIKSIQKLYLKPFQINKKVLLLWRGSWKSEVVER